MHFDELKNNKIKQNWEKSLIFLFSLGIISKIVTGQCDNIVRLLMIVNL